MLLCQITTLGYFLVVHPSATKELTTGLHDPGIMLAVVLGLSLGDTDSWNEIQGCHIQQLLLMIRSEAVGCKIMASPGDT